MSPKPDEEARPGRDRRAQAGDARARDRHRPRAGACADPRGGRLRRRLRGRVPVGDAGVRGDDHDRRRARPAPDPEHELVPPRGGALRRVRVELLGVQAVRRAALADRHRLPDERRAPLARDRDGVRVARRRGRADRGHDLSDLPRPPPARGLERDRARADRHLDAVSPHDRRPARAVLRRPLREPQDRLPRPARDARDPRPAHRLRRRVPGRERPVRLPAVLASRQRRLVAQERSPRPGDVDRRRGPAARAPDARGRRARRVPRAVRGDRHLRPLAGVGRGADPARPGVRGVRGRHADAVPLAGRRGRAQPGAARRR